jgi:hypothetical protein
MRLTYSLTVLITAVLTGCAMPSFFAGQHEATNPSTSSYLPPTKGVVREIDGPEADFKKTAVPRIRGDVILNAADTPFSYLLSELGRNAGYTVAYTQGVDTDRLVTVSFDGVTTEDAIKNTAFLAGYVAQIDVIQRTVLVAEVATYSFKATGTSQPGMSTHYTVGKDSPAATPLMLTESK